GTLLAALLNSSSAVEKALSISSNFLRSLMTTSFRARESVSAPIPEVFSPTVSAKKAQSQLWVKARFDKIVSGCEILADLATIVAAVLCAYFAYHSLQLGKRIQYSPTAVLGVAFAFACVGVWLLERNGAYRRDSS